MGTYGPVITDAQAPAVPPASSEDFILCGVPKVEYASGKCAPLPACLESLLAYTGQQAHCSYPWLAAATGISFRLLWNPGQWDPTCADAAKLYPRSLLEIYRRAYHAAGWTCDSLTRADGSKQDFAHFIRSNIDQGRPVIAAGIIGPPEACLITGYRKNGA